MIRQATPEDIPAITAIINRVIRETTVTVNSVEKTEAEVLALMQARRALGHELFVAEDAEDHGILGYATYAQFRGSVGYARSMEHSVALSKAGQGRGIGRALMAAVESHAAQAGAHVMIAAITADNLASITFHQRLGYCETARMPQVGYKFGSYHDLVLMQKFLS